MPAKYITPSINADSFSCPHCSAIAHQDWFAAQAEPCPRGKGVTVIDVSLVREKLDSGELDPDFSKKVEPIIPLLEKGQPALAFLHDRQTFMMFDINVSRCFSCKGIGIWHRNSLIYPPQSSQFEPNGDLSPSIQADFEEAGRIVSISPRGAAALLRLCVQKICDDLGQKGKTIDGAIAALVKEGLDHKVERALDIVRVIGNEAVHPGQIDLKDDRETADKLFELVNIIADTMISRPKRIQELYGKLPESKRKAIESRQRPLLTDQSEAD